MFLNYSCACLIIPSTIPDCDNRISKKANHTLGFLRRNIKIHSESLNSSAYKVLVRPQVEYYSTVWCPFTDSNISKLEAVQSRTARWVKHDYGQTSGVSPYIRVSSTDGE